MEIFLKNLVVKCSSHTQLALNFVRILIALLNQKDWQCTYNVIFWRFRITFIHPRPVFHTWCMRTHGHKDMRQADRQTNGQSGGSCHSTIPFQ
jgi:hypothetical protein